MSMTDPIADLLSRIRTAHMAKHDRLDLPASKLKSRDLWLAQGAGLYQRTIQLLGRRPGQGPDQRFS